jgi:hypothetical protein
MRPAITNDRLYSSLPSFCCCCEQQQKQWTRLSLAALPGCIDDSQRLRASPAHRTSPGTPATAAVLTRSPNLRPEAAIAPMFHAHRKNVVASALAGEGLRVRWPGAL